MIAKKGGWTADRQCPKTLKTKLNFKGTTTLSSLRSNELVTVRQGGWTPITMAKDAQGRVGNNSRKPRTFLKTSIVTA
jgi:hypothetical protein